MDKGRIRERKTVDENPQAIPKHQSCAASKLNIILTEPALSVPAVSGHFHSLPSTAPVALLRAAISVFLSDCCSNAFITYIATPWMLMSYDVRIVPLHGKKAFPVHLSLPDNYALLPC